MKITNKYGISNSTYKAILKYQSEYDIMGANISVTGLIAPPRQRLLLKRHDKQIEVDAGTMFHVLDGQADHTVIEKASQECEVLEEQKFVHEFCGWKVKGQADYWEPPHTLYDIKRTSVYAVKNNKVKPEWEAQTNIYGYFFRLAGFPVKKIFIEARLRDHLPVQAMRDRNYPQIPYKKVSVPVWNDEKVLAYIEERVKLHQKAEELDDNDLSFCTEDERWTRPTKWAVMKKGRKSAIKLYDDDEDARNHIDDASVNDRLKLELQERPGENIRCARGYCKAAPFCNQWANLNPVKEADKETQPV